MSVFANPVPADDLSLANGLALYDLHCAECHGGGSANQPEQWYATGEDDGLYDFSGLVDIVVGEPETEQPRTIELDSEEEWPEWAELPDPGSKANDPSVRAEIMEEISRAIDEAYGPAEEPDALGLDSEFNEQDYSYADDYGYVDDASDRMLGATDLTDPETFFYGISEQNLFDTIANGTGVSMPGWRFELEREESIWDLVNYIRSLWGEEWLD